MILVQYAIDIMICIEGLEIGPKIYSIEDKSNKRGNIY